MNVAVMASQYLLYGGSGGGFLAIPHVVWVRHYDGEDGICFPGRSISSLLSIS